MSSSRFGLFAAGTAIAALIWFACTTAATRSVRGAAQVPPITAPTTPAQPAAAVNDWQPPIGIPTPDFGIGEVAPAPPSPWNGPVPGFYYVNLSAPGATDSNNPYGSPLSPRATVPTRLPAGSVVEIHGVYDRSHADAGRIRAAGTADAPVFIRGESAAAPADIVQGWEVSGSYLILENLRFRARDSSTTGSLVVLAPVSHLALRHSEVSGNLNAGGVGIESWNPPATSSHVVIWDNRVHDNGNVRANFDQDRHGIHVGDHVDTVWVLDNEMWRNSGDGIQISARTAANQPTTHHIYVGRNVSHGNKQNGFWTKQAVDVIFSQNVTYSNRPSNSSMGVGLGFQYAPDYVWFLFNHVYDSDYGIQTGSDSDLGTGTESFYIGNVIHDIHDSTNSFKPGTAWQNCGIGLAGGINRYIVNNTIVDADSGICTPSATGKLGIYNNLVFGIRNNGRHVFLEFPRVAVDSKASGNVFGPNYNAMTAGVEHRFDGQRIGGRGENAVVIDPGVSRVSVPPFDLLAGSPAIDFGVDDPAGVYRTFEKRYGIDIRVDILGRARPSGRGYDAGAFESTGTPTPLKRR